MKMYVLFIFQTQINICCKKYIDRRHWDAGGSGAAVRHLQPDHFLEYEKIFPRKLEKHKIFACE